MTKIKNEWWFSRDERKGFNWASVCGYDYHAQNGASALQATIYVYVESGIVRVTGDEAVTLFDQMKGRFKQL